MILENQPADFSPTIEVVGCYLHYKDTFLLLQRRNNKAHGGKWGLPAGKVDQGENIHDAILREVREETGINLAINNLQHRCAINVRNGEHDLIFHIFETNLISKLDVVLSENEHQSHRWVTPTEAMALDYIHDLDGCNRIVFGQEH